MKAAAKAIADHAGGRRGLIALLPGDFKGVVDWETIPGHVDGWRGPIVHSPGKVGKPSGWSQARCRRAG